ncbi:KPN_02809 family neutral zinc metallopeptidase [Planctomicrobium sp. SH668]|uniref:KPN_02809 family neutral zinc metallopeptidase n=1 Tax=Planctomicrobium sp. SH668 TaxID=3448126 RepID=UPI003F5B5063
MRWESGRRSDNVDDRRSMKPRGIALGGGGTILMAIMIYFFSGGDLGQVLRFFLQNQGGGAQQQAAAPDPEEDKMADFAKVILGDTEDVWTQLFRQNGRRYTPTKMVLYRGQVSSGCGNASAAAGPFYCPADQQVYIDLSFFDELDRRFGAPGEMARAYVIAHEVAHHVQNLMGTMDKRQELLRYMDEKEFSVRLELQADFLAGVWAHHAHDERKILEPGDIESALQAATAIGDDALQKQSQGYVVKESFTHGSSAQRVRWFKKGFETGDINQGDTFSARSVDDL